MSRDMHPHEQRVVQERAELNLKVNAMTEFFSSETFRGLSEIEQHFLFKQHTAMVEYRAALDLRIGLFELMGARVK